MTSLARRAVVAEVGVWRSLFCWITRRRPGQAPGAQAFPYAKEVLPILWVFLFLSFVELPVVHLLLPWETVRLVVLVLSVWGLLWMVGYLASMKVFPHVIDDEGLLLRTGATFELRVPWSAIETVRAHRGRVAGKDRAQFESGTLAVPMMKQTKVEVVLRGPRRFQLRDEAGTVDRVRFYADDPKAVVDALQARLAHYPDRSRA